MNPQVSVIIPAYNTENYIARAIESVLAQTLTNIELIVVDDGSTDATVEAIKSFSDPRLKCLVNEKNSGVSRTRNRALAEAKGEWIAVLDSDDWFVPERLEKLLQIATVENADIIIDDLNYILDGENTPWSTLLRESGEQIPTLKHIDATYFIETGIYGQRGLHLGLSKPLFKRSFLIENQIQYDATLQVAEDCHLMLQCLVKGADLIFIPKPYYFYRARPGSLVTQSKVRHITQSAWILQYFLQQDTVQNNPRLVQAISKSLAVLEKNKAYYSVVEPIKSKQWSKALMQLFMNPGFWTNFITRVPGILQRRIAYYFFKDKTVYNILRYF